MEHRVGSTVTSGFPIDDAHGNTDAIIARDGTGGYTVNDRRSYDAWGNLRYSQATGDPKQRHCASLGYQTDDETLLTYMRARYYDLTSGRFMSQDPARVGLNHFAYASNDPVNLVDRSGKSPGGEIIDILVTAVEIYKAFQSGDVPNVQEIKDDLYDLVEDLQHFSRQARAQGQAMMKAGQLDEEAAAFTGSFAEIQFKIGQIEQGLGAKSMAYGVAAQLGMKCIEALIELL